MLLVLMCGTMLVCVASGFQPGGRKKKPQYKYRTVEELKVGLHCLLALLHTPARLILGSACFCGGGKHLSSL